MYIFMYEDIDLLAKYFEWNSQYKLIVPNMRNNVHRKQQYRTWSGKTCNNVRKFPGIIFNVITAAINKIKNISCLTMVLCFFIGGYIIFNLAEAEFKYLYYMCVA